LSVAKENGQFRLPNYPAKLEVVVDDTWVVSGTKSDELLAHEQVHFDITGLSGRDMVREMIALRAKTVAELQREVTRITQRYQQLANDLTEKYDRETNHSRNPDQQKRWATHIKNCIDSDKPLSAPP
jgi:predicted secreted Zn-dependent protease